MPPGGRDFSVTQTSFLSFRGKINAHRPVSFYTMWRHFPNSIVFCFYATQWELINLVFSTYFHLIQFQCAAPQSFYFIQTMSLQLWNSKAIILLHNQINETHLTYSCFHTVLWQHLLCFVTKFKGPRAIWLNPAMESLDMPSEQRALRTVALTHCRFVVVNRYTYGCLQTLLPASSPWAVCRGRWASSPQGRRGTSLDDHNKDSFKHLGTEYTCTTWTTFFCWMDHKYSGGDSEVFALPVVDRV